MSGAVPDRRRAFEDIFARPIAQHGPPQPASPVPPRPPYEYEQRPNYYYEPSLNYASYDAASQVAVVDGPTYANNSLPRLSQYSQVPLGPRPLPTLEYHPSRPFSVAFPPPDQWMQARPASEASHRPPQRISSAASSERTLSFTQDTRRPLLPSPHSSMAVPSPSYRPIKEPAFLSKVAEAFRQRVVVQDRIKDGLSYKDAFVGREAVDKLSGIIKTTDRNLALLLGRALDAQKFFHDVTYDHRLRDSPHELYQFRMPLFRSADDDALQDDEYGLDGHLHRNVSASTMGDARSYLDPFIKEFEPSVSDTFMSEDNALPTGIFTLLTDCYSATCTRNRLCYSIACPRRLEQQARLKMKPQPVLKREESTESLGDLKEPGTLWIHSVPKEVADSVDDKEQKRQEAINEAIYTERDFLRDVDYLKETWIKGIKAGNAIPEERKEDFILQVFWNVADIRAISHKLAEQLSRRQKQSHIVYQIGDIYLEHVRNFQPFVQYGAHQLYGKYEFEREKNSNPAFARFVEETERAPESRKLELNAYLTKPTTRLARYPLLLEVVHKYTPEDHPDHVNIPKAIKTIREFLTKVNEESGKSENRFNLAQLETQLVFKREDQCDLGLKEEGRELAFKGFLKKRGGTGTGGDSELQGFLFDHALVFCKPKNKLDQYKVYRRPIPLELLVVSIIDEGGAANARASRVLPARNLSTSKTNLLSTAPPPPATTNKSGYAINFTRLGKRGYELVLWAQTWAGRKNWLEQIEAKQTERRERSTVFEPLLLSEGYFVGSNRVTCAAPFDAGQRIVYGTDSGVFIADLRDKTRVPIKVIALPYVTQVEVLDEYGILIVLADKAVTTFYIDHLDPNDAVGAGKRAKKVSNNANFFKAGVCIGRTLVCVVKASANSSTIKTLEPTEPSRAGTHKKPLRKFLPGNHEILRIFKEFYIPISADSLHFLKTKLCVGSAKGFEIVDLETLDTQGLLDPADSALDFVQKVPNVQKVAGPRPLDIFRVETEFLLCYDEFAFYVNKNGWRTKGNWIIHWEGRPTHFAVLNNHVIAFEPTFVEVRSLDTGALKQIIVGSHLRLLYSDATSASSSAALPPYYQSGVWSPDQRFLTNGSHPRDSMYSYNPNAYARLPAYSTKVHTQIIFSDNYHQVYKFSLAPA